MTDYWINNRASMSCEQRLNLATFLAKLASTRVSKDRVCQIALLLFRWAFGEGRELTSAEDSDGKNTHRSISMLVVQHLIPPACAWIKEAGYNLILLSNVPWNDCPSTISRGGPMFVESEFGKRSPTGFTPWRWMF
ncbi:hypothetical protein PSPO01_00228 [Paraphaeosphaeria sporulosa]